MKNSNIYKQLVENKNYLIPLSIYTFLFLFFCSKMSPLYPINEWSDVNVYFNVGKGMLSGMTLYSEIFDHKGPFTFIIYGIGSLVSGNSFIGMFILQLLAWLVAMYAIFLTAKLLVKTSSAFFISLLLPIASMHYMSHGGSAEEMALLLSFVSFYFFTVYFTQDKNKKHNPKYMFVHGVLTAMVFMIKLNLMLLWFFPLLAIFLTLLISKEYKNFLQNCLAYLAGFALVCLPVLIYFLYNGALGESYHVYIELNKQYSSTDDYMYLFTNGVSKLYKAYRANLVWYIVITVGIFYFPIKYFKNKLAIVAFMLSGISLFGIIFFPLTFHYYYPLPLYVFVTFGLMVLFSFLEKYINIRESKKLTYIVTALVLILAINNRDFFGLGAENILRKENPQGPQFQFRDAILKEQNPTLLNIAYGNGMSLFTSTGVTPTVKYFFSPNIYYEMFPDVRDQQSKYIENKEIQFIVNCDEGFNYEYFSTFEPLKNNYTMIDSCKMTDYGRSETYYLYKRKD